VHEAENTSLRRQSLELRALLEEAQRRIEQLRREKAKLEVEVEAMARGAERGGDPLSREVTPPLDFVNAPLSTILGALTTRTGLRHVLAPEDEERGATQVTVSFEGQPLKEVLAVLGAKVSLNWRMEGRQVVFSSAAAVVTTESGLQIVELALGDGPPPRRGQTVVVHYTGWLTDGTQFDSSRKRDAFRFPLGVGRVIEGWDEGVAGMRVGGKRRLIVPPQLAYGERAIGPIPANSTLVFEVELLGVE